MDLFFYGCTHPDIYPQAHILTIYIPRFTLKEDHGCKIVNIKVGLYSIDIAPMRSINITFLYSSLYFALQSNALFFFENDNVEFNLKIQSAFSDNSNNIIATWKPCDLFSNRHYWKRY